MTHKVGDKPVDPLFFPVADGVGRLTQEKPYERSSTRRVATDQLGVGRGPAFEPGRAAAKPAPANATPIGLHALKAWGPMSSATPSIDATPLSDSVKDALRGVVEVAAADGKIPKIVVIGEPLSGKTTAIAALSEDLQRIGFLKLHEIELASASPTFLSPRERIESLFDSTLDSGMPMAVAAYSKQWTGLVAADEERWSYSAGHGKSYDLKRELGVDVVIDCGFRTAYP